MSALAERAEQEGRAAYERGVPRWRNPYRYRPRSPQCLAWAVGWALAWAEQQEIRDLLASSTDG